jgi:DNA-binding helix-hairpin-helix protein with protein kinase domain
MSAPPTALLAWPEGRREAVQLIALGKSGGSGEVFAVAGHGHLVAKRYHAQTPAATLAVLKQRLTWMIAHPPRLPPAVDGVVQLAWPVALLEADGAFAGFAMPKIDFERTLELDYLLSRRQAQAQGFAVDYGRLCTVCHNLAALVDSLHGQGLAIVDLKPMNLKIDKATLTVCVLDCDGFHCLSEGPAGAGHLVTPEYLAPEFHGRSVARPEQQDRFALATIIFRLLNFGVHPYTGISPRRLAHPHELAGRMARGLYAYGRTARPDLRPIAASVHETLPETLREHFDQAFDPGRAPHERTSAGQWALALRPYALRVGAGLVACAEGHLHFTGLPCGSCLRERLIQAHAQRQQRLGVRLRASPRRALHYVRRALQGTHSSPFQAALAQAVTQPPQGAPLRPLHECVAVELLWALGLAVTAWWVL